MTDVDAIARLLDVGFNAVFLFLLWRVYQDFMIEVRSHRQYMEKLVDKLLPVEDLPPVPAYRPPPMNGGPYISRTPTSLGENGA